MNFHAKVCARRERDARASANILKLLYDWYFNLSLQFLISLNNKFSRLSASRALRAYLAQAK